MDAFITPVDAFPIACRLQSAPECSLWFPAPALRLVQERFVAQDRAKLLGSIVAGDPSGQRKQSLSVASGQNQPPTVAARIASIELISIFCLHSTLRVFRSRHWQNVAEAPFQKGLPVT